MKHKCCFLFTFCFSLPSVVKSNKTFRTLHRIFKMLFDWVMWEFVFECKKMNIVCVALHCACFFSSCIKNTPKWVYLYQNVLSNKIHNTFQFMANVLCLNAIKVSICIVVLTCCMSDCTFRLHFGFYWGANKIMFSQCHTS